MNRTFGAPSDARFGAGHAGLDSSAVRPITPGNRAPGSYSIKDTPNPHHVDVDNRDQHRWPANDSHHPNWMTKADGARNPAHAQVERSGIRLRCGDDRTVS